MRSRVAREATRRGLVVSVGAVRMGWFSATLQDVVVAPEGVSGVSAKIDFVHVDVTAGLSVSRVSATGLVVHLEGDAMSHLAEWRERHASTQSEPSGHRTPLTIERGSAKWEQAFGLADASAESSGITLRRDDAGIHLTVESVTATRASASVALGPATADIAGGQLGEAHIDSAKVALELEPTEKTAANEPAVLPDPPPVPIVTKRSGSKPPVAEPFRPVVPLPNPHALRALVQTTGARIATHVPAGLHVQLDALTVELTRGKEKLELGPGKVGLERQAAELALDFSAGTGQTPLAVHASLPLGTGDTVIALSGGPVTLSMLGVREGAFGFVDPGRASLSGKARLSLDDPGGTLTFDGDVAVASLSVKNPKLADETIRNLGLRLSGRGVLDGAGAIRLDDGEIQLGSFHLRGRGGLEQTNEHLSASLSFEIPIAACQSLLDSVPGALLPHLVGARFRGTLGAKGYVSFDTRKIDDLVLKYDFDDSCRMTTSPEELRKDRFEEAFTYGILDKDGKPTDRETGPGSEEWASIDNISSMMQVAVLTTEDGAFYRHRGFNHSAIRSALVADIKAGRFVRGASTISMQLAKNLFLSREKTLSRKLEEVILADYLEKTFHKEQMMELYLNVIEFGPDLYGVKSAAAHYFGRRPAELNLAECLFLSSLLPRPRDYHKIYEKGELPQSWINNIHQLMDVARKTAKISDQELQDGLAEVIVFHKEDAPPPTPRLPVRSSHFSGTADDWDTN